MTGHDAGRLAPLPIRPRPAAGEPAGRYIRRLAAANHLRPSYLHSVLRNPFPIGSVSPERLAALSGRSAQALKRTLRGLDSSNIRKPPLAIPGPGIVFLRGPAGLHDVIDAWADAEPGISALQAWERLVDQHEADISYVTVRAYLRPRSRPRRQGQPRQTAASRHQQNPETNPKPPPLSQ